MHFRQRDTTQVKSSTILTSKVGEWWGERYMRNGKRRKNRKEKEKKGEERVRTKP